jgi:hypothetical protein
MNRTLKRITVLTVLALTISAFAGFALAADDTTAPQYLGLRMGRISSVIDKVAELIGLKADDVRVLRHEGKSLVDIAESNNISEDELVKAIVDGRKSQLDQFVKDGKITQAQYDTCLELMEERVETAVNRDDFGPGNGMGNGARNGSRGMGRGMARRQGAGFGLNR